MATTKAILRARKYSPSPAPQDSISTGRFSPLAMQLADQHGYANAYSGFLPRPPVDFTQGAFGPFSPILPVPVDEPESSGRAEPRREEYRVGWNLPVGTPGSEGLKLASFSTLRTLADLYSVARACIQLRKSEIRGLEWDIMPTQEAAKANRGDKKWFKDFGERRAKARKFFKRPDPDYYSWNTFLDAFLEEVFVFDALSLYLRPKRGKGMGKGVLGSDLDSLNLINGPTIRPLYDMHGGYPAPPAPAYQQYLYGVPRSDFMKMLTEMDIEESGLRSSQLGAFRGDQLLYIPMVPRRWTPYGFPPIERAMIPVMSGLQKQGWQLDYFREGTVPSVYMSPGDENMTPNQIRELQEALNAFAGDPAWHHKIIVLPPGTRVEPQRDTQLADQFDEIVMTQVCMAFDIMPMELGIAPKVSTSMSPGASNQMAKMAQSIGERKATKPTLMFIADIMNSILQTTCGQDDMQFVFEGLEAEEDQVLLTELLVNQIKYGLRSVDEARDELSLQPWGLPETSGPVYMAPTGPIPFGAATPIPGQPAPGTRPALPGVQPSMPVVAGGSGGGASSQPVPTPQHVETPAHAAAQGHAETSGKPNAPASASGQVVKPPRGAAPTSTNSRPKVDEAGLLKAATNELDALSRHVKKGRQVSSWVPRAIAPDALARISQHMAEGLEIDEAIKVVKSTRRIVSLNGQESWINAAVPHNAAGGGGRSPVRHLGDGTEVPGGVPANTAGGEPPRWIPSQPPNGYMGGFYDGSDRSQAHHPLSGRDDRMPVGVAHDTDVNVRPEYYPTLTADGWPQGGHGTGQSGTNVVPGNENDRGRAPSVSDMKNKAAKLNKEDVHYRSASNSQRECGTCVMFRPDALRCTLVRGVIHSDDVCDRWEAKNVTKTACVAAGLAVRAADTGRVLMLQRAMSDGDPAAGMWEFPGGRLEPGEDARNAAVREWQEETGLVLPVGRFIGRWWAGVYEGYIYEVDSETDLSILDGRGKVTNPDDPDGDAIEAIVWWNPLHLVDNPSVRSELLDSVDMIRAILDGHPAQKATGSSAVENIMAENFLPEGYSWVKDASWDGPRAVNTAFIDFDDVDSWAAYHDDEAVAHFRERMKAGEKMKPAILVKEPDNPYLKVIDGHHRVLAARSLRRTVWAYIGTVSAKEGPWSEAHSFQIHHGRDALNKDVN